MSHNVDDETLRFLWSHYGRKFEATEASMQAGMPTDRNIHRNTVIALRELMELREASAQAQIEVLEAAAERCEGYKKTHYDMADEYKRNLFQTLEDGVERGYRYAGEMLRDMVSELKGEKPKERD